MLIISIDTSCDETSVAVTFGRRILSNQVYSQILIHKKWGGVVPNLAKRAHEEKIDLVIDEALKKAYLINQNLPRRATRHNRNVDLFLKKIDYLAVTYGPGLAPALEVGIKKAKQLAKQYQKKIIPIDHMEGHIYSCFGQNSRGNPPVKFNFPYLALLASGGHTQLVLFEDHLKYQILGETIDDAAGEALDKAAKLLGLGYPGGSVIERLAKTGDSSFHKFPRPLSRSKTLNFSFSGLKTAFFYHIKNLNEADRVRNLNNLLASYQQAVFDSLLIKLDQAIDKTGVKNILAGGGVVANLKLRKKIRRLISKRKGSVLFPPFISLYGDNAAMIGVAAYYKAKRGVFVGRPDKFDRIPRASLEDKLSF